MSSPVRAVHWWSTLASVGGLLISSFIWNLQTKLIKDFFHTYLIGLHKLQLHTSLPLDRLQSIHGIDLFLFIFCRRSKNHPVKGNSW